MRLIIALAAMASRPYQACVLRFRRKAGDTWNRGSLPVEPRSAYLLSGPVRREWEHSIPALDRLRYSITLRTLVGNAQVGPHPTKSEERA